ncbi:DNA helicase-2 / ATP-dependent DNA helicase PcrA [Pseudobutyrivibrio sp. NOR37]|uniref:DNA 3'-5' helicase n=1 Tax=Pseudobutyrivibrio xylanivorans TaxID=185007 RepID=A0A6M0LES6_PSEXY|nr:ATP-dependent helicase [Pseudobutyrivibrio xylanivorans]SFR64033.1 DNA helicase-2 / ATP-dependent DNA helicase PcrA [Pseudobutyrivibrio sp. NOR37]
MNFNDSQIMAISHKEGPCLVVAGPGSGKTAVITHRINELINSGIPGREILVITFTKAAAIEMKERFNRLSGNNQVTFGTFHSLFWGILQRELGYKSKDIVMGSARMQILIEAIRMVGLDATDLSVVNSISNDVTTYRNKGENSFSFIPEAIDREDFFKVYSNFKKLKQKYRVVDFDDMLSIAYELFINRPSVLDKWQNRYSYFLVDEMQDMNNLQFDLIKMLSGKTNNIFCVGDDDQSIYGFRGANPKIMTDFINNYDNCKRIILNYNYRNPSNVVKAALALIDKNSIRFKKDIIPTNKEGTVNIAETVDEVGEADYIYGMIKSRIAQGIPLDEIAVLYRNHSDAKYLINRLMTEGVPIYLKEATTNFYSHFIIEDIEAYFQIAIGNSTRSRLLRIINRPNRFLHRASVEKGSRVEDILYFYKDNYSAYQRALALNSDILLISRMSPYAAINYIRNVMGYDSFLKEEAIRCGTSFDEYTDVLAFLLEIVKDCKNIKQAIDKLNVLRYKVDYENKNKQVDKSGKVGLYTLHSSKGLEFDTVFILGANEGVIPNNRADTDEAIEGERRLFYVGVTRTKTSLFITYTNKKNREKSRFLSEMTIDYSSTSSSKISSNLLDTASYSSSERMFSRDGAPVSSSKYL